MEKNILALSSEERYLLNLVIATFHRKRQEGQFYPYAMEMSDGIRKRALAIMTLAEYNRAIQKLQKEEIIRTEILQSDIGFISTEYNNQTMPRAVGERITVKTYGTYDSAITP